MSRKTRTVRTLFAAALLACAAASTTAVSAAPAVKPAAVTAHVSSHRDEAALTGSASAMVKHDAAMTAPAAMQRHLPTEPGYSKNAEVEAKISPLSPVTPTSPITPAIDLPSIIP